MIKREQETANWGAPQGPGPVMSSVVHIQTEPVVPDHIIWSLFNSIYFNVFCLGLVAFSYSVKSRDRKMMGDVIGAQRHASTAKCLNIVALVLGLILSIVFFVLVLPEVGYAIMLARRNHGGY